MYNTNIIYVFTFIFMSINVCFIEIHNIILLTIVENIQFTDVLIDFQITNSKSVTDSQQSNASVIQACINNYISVDSKYQKSVSRRLCFLSYYLLIRTIDHDIGIVSIFRIFTLITFQVKIDILHSVDTEDACTNVG